MFRFKARDVHAWEDIAKNVGKLSIAGLFAGGLFLFTHAYAAETPVQADAATRLLAHGRHGDRDWRNQNWQDERYEDDSRAYDDDYYDDGSYEDDRYDAQSDNNYEDDYADDDTVGNTPAQSLPPNLQDIVGQVLGGGGVTSGLPVGGLPVGGVLGSVLSNGGVIPNSNNSIPTNAQTSGGLLQQVLSSLGLGL